MARDYIPENVLTERQSYTCPYFNDGRSASIEIHYPMSEIADLFAQYLSLGFRRYYGVFYKNVCKGCSACLPLRIDVSSFKASKSQKRTLRKNSDVVVEIDSSLKVTDEKVHLYKDYLLRKHNDDKTSDFKESLSRLYYGYPKSIEMLYYINERLVAVGLIDLAAAALSSNYFYYDLDCKKRRLGVFSVLMEIKIAQKFGLKYYYLGFATEGVENMEYKKRFRPAEILKDGVWSDLLF